ncbi:hypothetical protein OTB20_19225 [Streptomyces sp. H27-H1]|uniref:hypothetical protein n=1 Tax=Streptomyces sp. H27-H1 TaxID=2996461 RepID=UPI00226E45C2|nr:hypothetical protein [Streptomyces sp. H27-H1]MCY0928288.1 hypothetical protein [Streptomyces sp. H27-H1]
MTNLKKNANLVEALGSSLRSGDHGLKAVPGLVKRVLAEGAWRSFVTQRGELVEYDQFEEFVTTPPLKGLGASMALVRTLVRDDAVALDLFDDAIQLANGGDRRSEDFSLHNIQTETAAAPSGTSREAGLRRLRKDRPDLHAEVLAGTLTTHAAMVKAGFRRRMVNIPVDEPQAAAMALRRNLPPDAVAELAKLLAAET